MGDFGKCYDRCMFHREILSLCKAYVTCCFPHYIRMCFTNSSKHHSYWRRGCIKEIDNKKESQNPNDQGFEKMISGMYLGDIVRRVIHKVSLESDIFGRVSSKLSARFMLSTPLMAAMHEDDTPNPSEIAKILEETLNINDVPLKVRKLVVKICDVVTRRAARLAATGIGGILKKIGRDGTVVITSRRVKSGKNGKMRRTVVAIEAENEEEEKGRMVIHAIERAMVLG
ncbi:unnamed protein product [Lactuca saligna]|uniref:Phosphotransferase n=1 Tax=Lactuca saligna TaxID=75948 RepID=A0AA36EP58_LACSI|nr:unnamed protein product [Lactuca saligna]